ncbi:MAG TPA: hypothetical protein DHW14_01960, partial [Clostridiales bacterium]|nr:hypothetical protein [Clostridiales bacterium]
MGEEALTPEKHFRLSLETGRLLGDPRLLEEMCRRGPEALRELEREYGVRFDWSSGGCSVHRFGRPPLLGGFGLTGPLVSYLRRAGVRLFEGTVVTRIMVEDGRVEGVLAVSPGSAGVDLIAFAAPAVVVATGGGGAVYGRTDNPPRMTGDGYRLLRRAGAALVDMEFVQFYPLGVAEPGLPARLLDTSLLDFVRLTDETGAEPLAGRLEEWGLESWARANLFARDRLAVALARHAAAGHRLFLRTDEVRGDAVPGEYLEHLRGSFLRSFDLFSRPLRVAPTQHYFCGGAVFNERGEVLDAEGRPIPGL